MSEQKYNGWTNRETWLVSLWMSDEEMLRDIANSSGSLHERANDFQEYVEEVVMPTEIYDEVSFLSDLVMGAFAEINWIELVEAFEDDQTGDSNGM